MDELLELDDRRRVSLGKIGKPEHRRYLVTEEPDGTIILTPAAVVSEHELRLLAHPEVVARIQASREDPTKLVKHRRRRG
jgi:hypothetical protein